MELSELTSYAEEKYHIQEQRKWAEFPGFSVLADPHTGKWAALLMRQWDFDRGSEIQRCDLKCGRQTLSEISAPYLTRPFRMKGEKWIGVIFDDSTEADVVCRLFDRALSSGEQRGYTMVLESASQKKKVVYEDTSLPFPGTSFSLPEKKIPAKIREMQRLYRHGDGSFAQKCRNFYRQGKFMEAYEDDQPWTGIYHRYFTTYHDLTVPQLRGYFTWRSRLRKGDFIPVSSSLAYLYLYELLNGIGSGSTEDALRKMEEFQKGFLDSGIGDSSIYKNLRRWMLEYAVIHGLSPEWALQAADPALRDRDQALAVLRDPGSYKPEEVFSALRFFGGRKLEQSPVVQKDPVKGKQLFAAAWRRGVERYSREGRDLFTDCFGSRKSFSWRPLANAVYFETAPHPDADYILDPCRSYHCRGGLWQEERYDTLYFDRGKFQGFLHETDRIFRKYGKTGGYLRGKPEEAWAAPYGEWAVQSLKEAERAAGRPKITIDFSGLEQIRRDAGLTRDSLLTEAEREESLEPAKEKLPEKQEALEEQPETGASEGQDLPGVPYPRILLALLRGEPVKPYLKACHLMASVAADAINEALFDEIGDNVLESDGSGITLVEDYREELLQMLGGKIE